MANPKDRSRILVIGAGVSGATIARVLAEAGHAVVVAEKERHSGGLCHTFRHERTGILVHANGPHIFHSDDPAVWSFVERFATFVPYAHRVLAIAGGKPYPLPVTLETLSRFFERELTGDEARDLLAAQARSYGRPPANFEEQGRGTLGDAVYEAFFDGYTRKQWGLDPALLPASVFSRLPVRFDRDQSYFRHSRVAIPVEGYTPMIDAMLDHPGIELRYGTEVEPGALSTFRHVVYTGPLDAWFGHRFGRLPYRTLDFETIEKPGTHQPVATVNYCDASVPWTRITEHKHFAPAEKHSDTICFVERSRACGAGDTPFYPVRLAGEEALYDRYHCEAARQSGVSFAGRLATFRYIDMDVAIGEALTAGRALASCIGEGRDPPAFLA